MLPKPNTFPPPSPAEFTPRFLFTQDVQRVSRYRNLTQSATALKRTKIKRLIPWENSNCGIFLSLSPSRRCSSERPWCHGSRQQMGRAWQQLRAGAPGTGAGCGSLRDTPLCRDSDWGMETQLAPCRVAEHQLVQSSCSKVLKFELILFSSLCR